MGIMPEKNYPMDIIGTVGYYRYFTNLSACYVLHKTDFWMDIGAVVMKLQLSYKCVEILYICILTSAIRWSRRKNKLPYFQIKVFFEVGTISS